MSTWADVNTKKIEMRKEAVASLSEAEKEILVKVLELEWDSRQLKSPDIKKSLRGFIQQVIK